MNTKSIQIVTGFVILIFVLPLFGFAQEADLNREFSFDESNNMETVNFNVDKKTDQLSVKFNGELSQGSMKIRFFDPDGNEVAGFSLVCSDSVSNNMIISSPGSSVSGVSSGKRSIGSSVSSGSSASSQVSVSNGSSSSSSSTRVKKADKNDNKKNSVYSYEMTQTDKAGARGLMNKEIVNPEAGKWKYEIITEEASGKLSVEIRLD